MEDFIGPNKVGECSAIVHPDNEGQESLEFGHALVGEHSGSTSQFSFAFTWRTGECTQEVAEGFVDFVREMWRRSQSSNDRLGGRKGGD